MKNSDETPLPSEPSDLNEEDIFLVDVHLNQPGVIRFEECFPWQVLGQISRGEPLAPTCSKCGALLPRVGENFKRCPKCP